MTSSLQGAFDRLIQAVRSGNWEQVPQQAEAYGAAVRADERRRAIGDATDAIKQVFGPEDDLGQAEAGLRQRCLAALERLS